MPAISNTSTSTLHYIHNIHIKHNINSKHNIHNKELMFNKVSDGCSDILWTINIWSIILSKTSSKLCYH